MATKTKPKPKKVSFGKSNKSYAGAKKAVEGQSAAERKRHNAVWSKNKMFLAYKKTHPKVTVEQFRVMFLTAARNAALAQKPNASHFGNGSGLIVFNKWKSNLKRTYRRNWQGRFATGRTTPQPPPGPGKGKKGRGTGLTASKRYNNLKPIRRTRPPVSRDSIGFGWTRTPRNPSFYV